MSQQPGPGFTGRVAVVSLGLELGELKLVARGRRRLESRRILWRPRAEFQAVLSERRSRDMPAETLEFSSVAAVDALMSVEVNAADFSDGVVFVVNFADSWCGRDEQAEWGLACSVTGGGYSTSRSGIAGGKARLIGTQLGRLVVLPVLHDRVERAAVCSEDFLDALCRASGDAGDF